MWLLEEGESLLTYAVVINTDDTGLYCELESVRQRSIKAVFYPQVELVKNKHENTTRYIVN